MKDGGGTGRRTTRSSTPSVCVPSVGTVRETGEVSWTFPLSRVPTRGGVEGDLSEGTEEGLGEIPGTPYSRLPERTVPHTVGVRPPPVCSHLVRDLLVDPVTVRHLLP